MSIPKIKASVSNFEKIFKDSTWILKLNFEILHFFSRTGYVPKCKAISCPSPLPPLNGKVMDNGHYLVGNTVQYSCNEGFVLIGEPIIRCTESGLWSHAPPFCKYIVINLLKYCIHSLIGEKSYPNAWKKKHIFMQLLF